MLVYIFRVILFVIFVLGVMLIRKSKLVSPGKVIGLTVLFPVALYIIDYVTQLVLAVLEVNTEVICIVYTFGIVMTEILTVLVYVALYKNTVGESASVRAIMKRYPKWIYAGVGVLILLVTILYYMQNIQLGSALGSVTQINEGEDKMAAVFDMLLNFDTYKIYTYICNMIRVGIAVLMLVGIKKAK